MLAKVACGIGVAFVQESMNISTIFGFALTSIALENMGWAVIFIVDAWCWFEEHIYW
jgi:hypothetical protein